MHVETVDLGALGIVFPSDRIGLVVAQPHISRSELTDAEPYFATAGGKACRLAEIQRTLQLSRTNAHAVEKTHFTVFPEYSIPGLDGVAQIDAAMADQQWPVNTVVIGGVDGMTREQYHTLTSGPNTFASAQNVPTVVQTTHWVNTAVIWIKSADSTVRRWVQPKLFPAFVEQDAMHQNMFRGESVFVFKGQFSNGAPYRFLTLICFDWIARIPTECAHAQVMAQVNGEAGQGQLPISWAFVIQHNRNPCHETFLSEVREFFNQTKFPNATRDRACIVFANTAALPRPGRAMDFGASSVIASPQSLFEKPSSAPTFASGGPKFRNGSSTLLNFKDAVFRERGACVHVCALLNPASLVAGGSGKRFLLENAKVCAINGVPEPRAPDAEVPAGTKWVHDELDDIPQLSAAHPHVPLATPSKATQLECINDLRKASAQLTSNAIRLATADSDSLEPDQWASNQSHSLRHVVHSLSVLKLGNTTNTSPHERRHGETNVFGGFADVVAVRGATHESCLQHLKRLRPASNSRVLLVSRDAENTHWIQRFGSFLRRRPERLPEQRITEPGSPLHLAFQDLYEMFRGATTQTELSEAIDGALTDQS